MNPTPFNLDEFKAGRKAIMRDGRVVTFAYHNPDFPAETIYGVMQGSTNLSCWSDSGLYLRERRAPGGHSMDLVTMAPAAHGVDYMPWDMPVPSAPPEGCRWNYMGKNRKFTGIAREYCVLSATWKLHANPQWDAPRTDGEFKSNMEYHGIEAVAINAEAVTERPMEGLDPEVFRDAAERLIEGRRDACCQAIADASADRNVSEIDDHKRYFAGLFCPEGQSLGTLWWASRGDQGARVLALLWTADVLESELADADPYYWLKQAHADGKTIEMLFDGAWRVWLNPDWSNSVDCYRIKPEPAPLEFPESPAGRQWHNPEACTPEQVGIADGWRLLLKDEEIRQGDEHWTAYSTAVWRPSQMVGALNNDCGNTRRTRRPLPQASTLSTPKMVPLGPEDVPPGSAVRGPDGDVTRWSIIQRVSTTGIETVSFLIDYSGLQSQGWLIQRPGSDKWVKCEKREGF